MIEGPTSNSAGITNQVAALTATPRARTNSTLRGAIGEENSRSRSPRSYRTSAAAARPVDSIRVKITASTKSPMAIDSGMTGI